MDVEFEWNPQSWYNWSTVKAYVRKAGENFPGQPMSRPGFQPDTFRIKLQNLTTVLSIEFSYF
jgi:hypothetical protein